MGNSRRPARMRAWTAVAVVGTLALGACGGPDTATDGTLVEPTTTPTTVDGNSRAISADGTLFTEGPEGGALTIADEGDPCASAKDARACTDVVGQGGRFLVMVVPDPHDAKQVIAQVYDNQGLRAVPVLASEPTTVGPADDDDPTEYVDITLGAADVGRHAIAVVTFVPSAATAPSPLIDLVAWEQGDDEPLVAVHIDGGRSASFRVDEEVVTVTEPDYTDGSPGCCPKNRSTRTIRRLGPDKWEEAVATEPYDFSTGEPYPPLDTSDPKAVATEVYDAWRHHDRDQARRGATDDAIKVMFEDGFPSVEGEAQCTDDEAEMVCAWPYEGGAVAFDVNKIEGGAFRVTKLTYIVD